MSKRKTIILLLLLLILVSILCIYYYILSNGDIELKGPYQVVRIVDGDTIILDINGINERVRLIGIDTPESVHPDPDKNVPYGKAASDFTKSMLENNQVQIELDVQERDQYGRLLAYVYYDGEMFNKILLKEGHAVVATYPPNIKYVDDFTDLQEKARKEGKGLWGK
jgi:micrococcal nuclease